LKKYIFLFFVFLSFSVFSQEPVISGLYYLYNPDYFPPKETDTDYAEYTSNYEYALNAYKEAEKMLSKYIYPKELFDKAQTALFRIRSTKEREILWYKIHILRYGPEYKQRYFKIVMFSKIFTPTYEDLNVLMEIDPNYPKLKEMYYQSIEEVNAEIALKFKCVDEE